MAGILVWAAVWGLYGTALSQTPSGAHQHAVKRQVPLTNARLTNVDTWTCSSGDGKWSNPNNWDSGLPTDTSDVTITNACPSLMDESFGINNLIINMGSRVEMPDGVTLNIDGDSITDNGQLFLNNSGGSVTELFIVGASVTLSGNGSLTMSNSNNNSITGNTGNAFINYLPSTPGSPGIQGAGNIGEGQLTLQNYGTINANVNASDKALTIQPGSGGMTNAGILETTNGTLVLKNGTFQNQSGSIETNGGSVILDHPIIIGGTLSTNGGVITPGGSSGVASLQNLTLAFPCQYQVGPKGVTYLVGTIANDGLISLKGISGSRAYLATNSTTTVNGNGTVVFNGPYNGIEGTGTFVNGYQMTVQGTGGTVNVTTFNNQGKVIATTSNDPVIIQCGSGTGACTNSGMIEGEGGGTVNVACTGGSGCMIDNTGGMISAATLNGGITAVSGTFAGTVEGVNATLNGVTISPSATFLINSGDSTTLTGSLNNSGVVDMTAPMNCTPCSNATAVISGTVNNTGAGTWDLKSVPGFTTVITGTGGQSRVPASAGDTLNNSSTIQGTGIIGNNSMNLVNTGKGVINANSSLPLTMSMGPGNSFTNQGLLTVAAIGGQSPSLLTITGPFKNFNSATGTLTGGGYNISGTLQFDNANIVTNAAQIALAGQIVNQNNVNALLNFANNTGSLTLLPPTFQNLTTSGTFTNSGKFTVSKGSAFTVGGSNGNYNQSGGTTTVDGTLAVPTGLANITGGTLQGAGTFSGNVSVGNASGAAATFIIGDSIKKAGAISITNNYTQLATGVMDVQLGGLKAGSQYSQVNITGTASLNGTLNINPLVKTIPPLGTTFTILSAPSGVSGTFSTVNGTKINASEHFQVNYNPTSVDLAVVSGP
jgi:fibronectin-binding autotransporter adhesin